VSREAFVDFCILCGCDYTGTIRGVGPMSAFKLLKQHGSIEALAATLDSSKLPPAESWQAATLCDGGCNPM
jgi:flap endonuclease-1